MSDRVRPVRWSVVLPCSALFLSFALMLGHLVFNGWAHSFDTAIYVRSLWGVAHADWMNSMVGLHSLSVHGNWVLFLLAPFAWVVHPAVVLIVAQAAALVASTALVSLAWLRVAERAGFDRWSQVGAVAFAAFAFVVGSPMVSNPFLFDVRPDLIGIPLLIAGLLRAQHQGAFDKRALAWMLASLLVREEFMMVIVGALALCPTPRPWRQGWRLRATGIAIAIGYWAFYWFGVRSWMGDGSYAIAQQVGAGFLDDTTFSTAEILGYKAELLIVFGASVGATVLLGWRWLGAAAPGLLFMLITSRMQDQVLNFHYVMFVIPGLAVASVDGFERWVALRRSTGSLLPILAAVALTASYVGASAMPGGGRHSEENFRMGVTRGVADAEEYVALQDAYRLVEQVPDGVPAVLPHELAAPFANRSVIWSSTAFLDALRDATLAAEGDTPALPADVDWVVVPGARWETDGRLLVERYGFRLFDASGSRLALLARADNPAPEDGLLTVTHATTDPATGETLCSSPVAVWPQAGLTLCGVAADGAGRLAFEVARTGPAAIDAEGPALTFFVRPGADSPPGPPDPALAMRGLLTPSDVPANRIATFVTSRPLVRDGHVDVELLLVLRSEDGSARPIGARSTGADALSPSVALRW